MKKKAKAPARKPKIKSKGTSVGTPVVGNINVNLVQVNFTNSQIHDIVGELSQHILSDYYRQFNRDSNE